MQLDEENGIDAKLNKSKIQLSHQLSKRSFVRYKWGFINSSASAVFYLPHLKNYYLHLCVCIQADLCRDWKSMLGVFLCCPLLYFLR